MVRWPGAEGLDEFDSRLDDKCQAGAGLGHDRSMIGRYEKGRPLFKADELTKRLPVILNEKVRQYMPTQVQMLSELTEEVRAAAAAYETNVKTFRGSIKNDIASFKASADSIEVQTRKMEAAYKNTIAVLTSQEFSRAIENAERLAAALTAIGALQSHKITFAVLDSKPNAPD